jgi:diguanylate cyclase (GGDEF)-like protein/PAS domain S-box-containing protein
LLSAAVVLVLAIIWKFGVEEWVDPFLPGEHAPDSLAERWEFVIAAGVFSALAMVLPAIVVYRLVDQLLSAHRMASAVFNAAPQPMVVTDAKRRVLAVNPAFEKLTGLAAVDVIGQPVSLLKSDQQDTAFYATLAAALDSAGIWSGEVKNRRPDGSQYVVWLSITATRDEEGSIAEYVGVLTDITWRKQREEAALRLAMHDQLTGLANRRMFMERLNQVMAAAQISAETVALLFIDLDGFKAVNDTHGHAAGDAVLREAAARLSTCARSADLVSRLAGDEFVILLREVASREAIETVAERCLESLSEPMTVGEAKVTVGASIGVAMSSHRVRSADDLLHLADRTMYQVKRAGRGAWRLHGDDEGENSAAESECSSVAA